MIRDLEFFVTEAWIGMRRSSLMTFISMGTITVCLIIFGMFLLMVLNFNNLANFVASKLEIRVFLNEGLTPREIDEFQVKLAGQPDVKDVQFVPKEQAWETFKTQFKNVDLSDLVQRNPLPNMFRVILKNNAQITHTTAYIEKLNYYVDTVSYGGEIAQRIEMFARYSKIGGLLVVILLGFSTLLIIMNTIRLTVIARQEEITIMGLVGATPAFIKWPFIIEGLIIGLVGSGASICVLRLAYEMIGKKFQEHVPFFPLVFDPTPLNGVYIIILFSGVLLGILGAYIAVSRSLKSK